MMDIKTKKISIGIVCFNRLHYLKALLKSARKCIDYPNIEWIIVDGGSSEKGTMKYLNSLSYVDHLLVRPCTHVEAMNYIVEKCSSEYLLMLPDDFQFIVQGAWIKDMVDLVDNIERVGSIVFNAQRRITLDKFFPYNSIFPKIKIPAFRTYGIKGGQKFLRYGKSKLGINPAGIGTFTRVDIWREMGIWKEPGTSDLRDSSGGGEDYMARKYMSGKFGYERVLTKIPVAASIHAGPGNAQAFIRNNHRYDHYIAPSDLGVYYKIWGESEIDAFEEIKPAASFEDIVRPIGYELEYDEFGNFIKNIKKGDEVVEPLPKREQSKNNEN